MKFTILSHAGLRVEHGGVSLVTDPWLIGSCYWRSWWNFPEPPAELLGSVEADFVYLTHLHWDHYHGPSLRRFFGPSTTFLLPKVCTTRMMDDLRSMGFFRFVEIPHGGTHEMAPDFTLCSYQFGVGVDSAAFIKGGGVSILNANDCKLFGQPLRHLLRKQGRPDFALRSHSSASPIPYCVDNYKKNFGNLRTQSDYIEDFARFAISVGARYAVPFASNHCFLHRDTFHFNDTAVSPDLVERYCNKLAKEINTDTDCVVMSPGSSWSQENGFELEKFEFDRRREVITEMAKKYANKLESFYAEEEEELADFDAFREYFEAFLAAVPWWIRRRWKPALMFRVPDARQTNNWYVDPATRTVEAMESEVEGVAIIEVPPRVINDCSTLRMFSAWTPSKRLKIELPEPGALKTVKRFFTLVDAYELDNLPLRKNFRPRNLAVLLRRWREGAEAIKLVLKHKVFRRPFDIPGLYPLPGVSAGQVLSRPEITAADGPSRIAAPHSKSSGQAPSPPAISWVKVARAEEIEAGETLAVERDGVRVVLVRIAGEVFAMEDRCSHRGARLSKGKLEGCEIECPLHGARFDVRNGAPQCPPAKTAVTCFEVRVDDGHVQVGLPTTRQAGTESPETSEPEDVSS